MAEPQRLKIKDAADVLGVGRDTLRRWVKEGDWAARDSRIVGTEWVGDAKQPYWLVEVLVEPTPQDTLVPAPQLLEERDGDEPGTDVGPPFSLLQQVMAERDYLRQRLQEAEQAQRDLRYLLRQQVDERSLAADLPAERVPWWRRLVR